MTEKQLARKTTVHTAGAIIAFLIGSGFATGQEALQYFAAFGTAGYAGIAVCLILVTACSLRLSALGEQHTTRRSGQIFYVASGRQLGSFFDYFSTVAIYVSYIAMMAGAAATIDQHTGVAGPIGAAVMALLTCLTVIFGLDKVVSILGRLGPLVIALIVLIGLAIVWQSRHDDAAAAIVRSAEAGTIRAASDWLPAAASYVGISIIWLSNFVSVIAGTTHRIKNVRRGICIGYAVFIFALALITFALQLNIDIVRGTEIPMLVLAGKISPLLAGLFTGIIVSGIYSASVPLLWTTASRIGGDERRRFRAGMAALSSIGVLVAAFVPFSVVVNVAYVSIGYVGFVLALILFGQFVYTLAKKAFAHAGN